MRGARGEAARETMAASGRVVFASLEQQWTERGEEGGARQLQWPAKIHHARRGVSGDDGLLGTFL